MPQYKFTITKGTDVNVVTPANGKRKLRCKRDGYRYRYSLDGQIELHVKGGYSVVRQYLDTNDQLRLEIFQKVSGSWVSRFYGSFWPKECEWDFDQCKVVIRAGVIDNYNDILLNQDTKINFKNLPGINIDALIQNVDIEEYQEPDGSLPYINHTFGVGYFELIAPAYNEWRFPGAPFSHFQYSFGGFTPNNPSDLGWGLVEIIVSVPLFIISSTTFDPVTHLNTTLVPATVILRFWRERTYTFDDNGTPVPPSGTNWIQGDGDTLNGAAITLWYRNPDNNIIVHDAGMDYTSTPALPLGLAYGIRVVPSETINYGAYWRKLSSVMSLLVASLAPGYTFKSDLLFNEVDVLNGADNQLYSVFQNGTIQRQLYIAQASDVIAVTPTETATKLEITFKQMMDMLSRMFNADWYISGTTVIFESLKYFEDGFTYLEIGSVPMPVVDIRSEAGVKARNKFTYEMDKAANSREFVFMTVGGLDFVGLDIKFNGKFNTEKQVKDSYDIRLISTDLRFIFENPADVSKDGFVLVVAELADQSATVPMVVNQIGAISGTIVTNGILCAANLQAKYHVYNQPFPTGQINGQNVVFNSVRNNLKQVPVYLSNCDLSLTPFKRYRTELGIGEVDEIVEDMDTGQAEVTLMHPQ